MCVCLVTEALAHAYDLFMSGPSDKVNVCPQEDNRGDAEAANTTLHMRNGSIVGSSFRI